MAEYDHAAREKIREALLDYMQRHGIGVPTLAQRIRDANPRKPEISIKTLQRFLAGQGRSFDMNVGFYDIFVSGQNVRDPVGELGQMLRSYYGSEPTRDYTGSYLEVGWKDVRSNFIVRRDEGFWRISAAECSTGYRLLKGAMVETNGAVIALLKDCLSGLPETYTFVASEDLLVGAGLKANFLDREAREIVPFPYTLIPL